MPSANDLLNTYWRKHEPTTQKCDLGEGKRIVIVQQDMDHFDALTGLVDRRETEILSMTFTGFGEAAEQEFLDAWYLKGRARVLALNMFFEKHRINEDQNRMPGQVMNEVVVEWFDPPATIKGSTDEPSKD